MPESPPARSQPVSIPGAEAVLEGRLFGPGAEPRVAVVLHAATGVTQAYYAKFAAWLAESRQAAVLTYDYRDLGASARGPVKASRATMADWGVHDQSAALDFLCARYPALPIWVVGHSLGGLCVPWHARAKRVARVIAVAAGPAHFLRHPLSFLPMVFWFWFLGGPVLAKLCGYLPGRVAGVGTDLPAGVYWQWRRWCTSRRFSRPDWGKAMPEPDLTSVTAELSLVAITDDVMITPATVGRLAEFYPAARTSYREITPQSIGVREIGHLRVFSEACRAAWPMLVEKGHSVEA
ncbi:MAG: alpha/beta fold hydrolase [Kiloniellales bacterium]|nr:alpha/beta fold hydrolase [Kiloniellales bacterium]